MITSKNLKTQDVISPDLETGRAIFGAGDYDAVVELVEAAIPRAENNRERFALLLLAAASFGEKQDYNKAFNTLQKAAEIIGDASGMSKARFYCQRAYLHGKFGNTDRALIDYEAARFWAKESGDRITEATARNNIAKMYSDAGRLDDAFTESDAAIKLGSELGSDWRLGRYHDQRAQILVDNERFIEALIHSEKAIALLADNPSLSEARQTYGRAAVGLFVKCTEREDPIESFCARRAALKSIPDELDKETVELALQRSKGHVLNAASLLGLTHGAVLKAIKRHGLQDLQQRKHDRKFRKALILK